MKSVFCELSRDFQYAKNLKSWLRLEKKYLKVKINFLQYEKTDIKVI